jgi:hypothetical protein
MARFGILDCPNFLCWNPVALLVAVSVTAVSYVVSSIAKTLSRS